MSSTCYPFGFDQIFARNKRSLMRTCWFWRSVVYWIREIFKEIYYRSNIFIVFLSKIFVRISIRARTRETSIQHRQFRETGVFTGAAAAGYCRGTTRDTLPVTAKRATDRRRRRTVRVPRERSIRWGSPRFPGTETAARDGMRPRGGERWFR